MSRVLKLDRSVLPPWQVGPKAANLTRLIQSEFSVPPGFVLPTGELDLAIKASGEEAEIAELISELESCDVGEIERLAGSLRETVRALALSGELIADIRHARSDLGEGSVSVRSSSTMEDRASMSFAGQHDSVLGLNSEDEILDAVKLVWSSLWSDRAVHYLRAKNVSLQQMRMAVIVQRMVDADVSGVGFSIHPMSGVHTEVMISASWGLGESTVSGSVNPDEIVYDRDSSEIISYEIGKKATMMTLSGKGSGQGIETRVVVDDQSKSKCLTDADVKRLANTLIEVEESMAGIPQDVEWAIAGGELILLQARPMVVPEKEAGPSWRSPVPGARWRRNWRLGEWLPGAVTPVTATWVLPKLVAAREEFGTGKLGWDMRPSFSMPKPWFCIVNGHFYTRQDFPRSGFGDMNPLERLQRQREGAVAKRKWHKEELPRYVEHLAELQKTRLADFSDEQLLTFVDECLDEAGEFWYFIAPIGYGFEEMGFRPVYEKIITDQNRPHYSAFFSGYPNRVTDSLQRLYEIAMRIKRADPDLTDRLLAVEANVQGLGTLPDWLQAEIAEFNREYGHQVLSLDVFQATLGETPDHVLRSLQSLVQTETQEPFVILARVQEKRELDVAEVLGQLQAGSEDLENLSSLIDSYQASASVREDANFYFQASWPLLRRALFELSSRLVARGVIPHTEDIFFLEKDEIFGAVAAMQEDGAAVDFAKIAIGRRTTWEWQSTLTAPDTLSGKPAEATAGWNEEEQTLSATGASPGIRTGRVRIVITDEDAREFVHGEVLVIKAASPLFTPLMLIARALVVEVGGGASHSSLVAREIGLPAVINAAKATTTFSNGQRVEVNGATGAVKLLDA